MPGSPSRRTPALVLAAAVLVGLVAVAGFYTSDGAAKTRERDARLAAAKAAGEPALTPTLEVETEIARSVGAPEIVELAGRLQPARSTWVSAEIAGRIVEVPTEEHARIDAGGLLVEIDSALPRAELIRAEANHLLAESELARQQRLGSRSVASKAELDAAIANERRTWAELLAARTRLDQTRITAPFEGRVNVLDLDPGTYVQPGTRIAEILDDSLLEVTVLVGDRQIGTLRPGDPAPIRIDVLGNVPFSGRIARVAGAPQDGGTRYPVVVQLESRRDPAVLPLDGQQEPAGGEAAPGASETAREPLPGMLAHVRFEIGRAPAIRLPARSILRQFELEYVFVLEDRDVARRVRVQTRPVPFRPDRVEITRGLEDGARVVVTAVDQLRSGMRVLVR